MSSEHLASAQTELKGDLGASWNFLDGASANYTDLGVARGFGGSSAAYSLRDIGSVNGSVVRVRRSPHDTSATINDEENFSANQVSSGSLEDWVNGKQETTLERADVATAAGAYSLRKVRAGYGIPSTILEGLANFPSTIPSSSSPADLGNGLETFALSGGTQDSNDRTVSNDVLTITATKSSAGTFTAGTRVKGLQTGKQYTVKGEFRVTSSGADGDATARVDVSDATPGTDEDFIETSLYKLCSIFY